MDAGDRLSVWSPRGGGALINPKGPGLRQLGLYSSSVRGGNYHRSAYGSADLRKGRWVDLVRQPDNPDDANAVMICSPGSRAPLGYVQRGRAPLSLGGWTPERTWRVSACADLAEEATTVLRGC